MKPLLFVAAIISLFLLAGCDSEKVSNDDNQKTKTTEENTFKGFPEMAEPALSERKTGDFFSSIMLPVSELDPETNQHVYVHLTGQVVNTNQKQTWAIVQDKGVAYFAFNHAGMPKIKKTYLGQQIYLRAIIEEKPLSESILVNIKNNGLAPGFATDNIVKGYQLNTTKAALADKTDEKTFMIP